eukprot:2994416-Alexandrium_andersonii.AAC.1
MLAGPAPSPSSNGSEAPCPFHFANIALARSRAPIAAAPRASTRPPHAPTIPWRATPSAIPC